MNAAGVSNKAIITAATYGNALALNLENDIGSLLAGRYANFVVLDANPYDDLATLSRPKMTVKRGVVADLYKGSENEN